MYRLTQEQKTRVKDLLSRMTLDEKIGQMNQESVSIVGGFDVPFEELIEMMTDGRITRKSSKRSCPRQSRTTTRTTSGPALWGA